MADIQSYENKYRRYLEDDTDTYLKPEASTIDKVISGGVIAAGIIGGGLLAYKKGGLKPLMHASILKAGRYRKGKISGFNESVRRFSEQEELDGMENAVKSVLKGDLSGAVQSALNFKDGVGKFKDYVNDGKIEHMQRMKRLSKSQLVDKNFEAQNNFAALNSALERLQKEGASGDELLAARKVMNDELMKMSRLDDKEQALKVTQTGFRFATVGDLVRLNEVNEKDEFIVYGKKLYEDAGMEADDFLKTRVDKDILIDEADQIADIRDFRSSFDGFINSLATDFTIPLIKINPLRMFYIDHFFSTKNKPMFFVASENTRQPIVTNHTGSINKPMLFSNGNIFEFENGAAKQIEGNYFLADANKGPVARLTRNMAGITISKFNQPKPDDPFMQRMKYHVGSFFDVGFQDEPPAQVDAFDPTSWAQGLINKFTSPLRQQKYMQRQDYLSDAFGADAEFIFMRSYKGVKEYDSYRDYLGQFTAGRKDMSEVTMGSLFPYGFFERLNATLNQVNLGLSNQSLGSAFDVFTGLALKRVAPIWAGMELWDYMNYESENFLGEQMSDRLAMMYANTSVEIAGMRDNLGITDWAKGVAPLLVGGEQIADIPFLGNLLDWNDTAEETADYWENGEEAVRKGRWWPLGNTPYTGMSIDYFQPNWVRRVLSDYEYSDSLYGSREEYFENSWMPTPRHPLAPIRHFFTDPYHWEEKHYYDRPYPVTGGIPELENFPLIGPILNSTIGQLLKPTRIMHPEYMTGDLQPATEGMPVYDTSGDIEVQYVDGVPTAEASPFTERAVAVAVASASTVTSEYASENIGTDISDGASVPLEIVEPVQSQAYVTSSGQIQVLQPESMDAVYEAHAISDEFSPMRTGMFKAQRAVPYAEDLQDTEAAMNPMGLGQATANLHYNMAEMGGFYGFMSTSITGEMYEDVPVLAKSSEMSSYSRAFWDQDIGGFGGDANEIFRRFLPKDRGTNDVNPIENTMPDYLPGSNYWVNFQTGDPYTKVKKGEMRLPGEGYERLYDIDMNDLQKLEIGASFIGYDDAQIRDHMLKRDAYKSESLKRILDTGTDWHKGWEKEMKDKGIAISMEQYVNNEEVGIGGFYDVEADHAKALDWLFENAVEFTYYNPTYVTDPLNQATPENSLNGFFYEGESIDISNPDSVEGFKQWALSQSDRALIDPKTRSTKRWEEDEMHWENVQQVNFYSQEMETPVNYLIHVDRDNPDKGIKVFAFGSNPELYDYSVNKVENVRQGIHDEIAAGELHRGDLYDTIDRYRILADVAPYSEEYRQMKSQISNMGLDEEEMDEVRTINQQVQARKDKNRFYDYRFKTANLEDQLVTIDQVIDANTFTTKEHPDNPIRLAGINVSTAKDNPIAQEAQRIINQTIQPGQRIRIAYDADEQNRVKNDTYKTIQSVVYDDKGRNLNKYLLDEGLAKEKENDWTAPSVHARFSPSEIQFGAAWEEFAHMDTMLHTKLLQVRSPLESYERREVYGKDWQEWQDPIDDFLIPAIQNAMTHNPILAIAGGGLIGMAFGSLKSSDLDGERVVGRYGKIVGGVLGASVMGAAVGYKMLSEAITGKAWIPQRRQEERDTEEYFDVLKYIKYNALYEKYAAQAMKVEDFDVKSYVLDQEEDGEFRQQKIKDLNEIKRRLYVAKPMELQGILDELERIYGLNATTREDAMKLINKEINTLQNHRSMRPLTPIAAKALTYKQAAEQTMYGYDAGDPVANILAALPKKDREYLVPFINAPEEERQRILDIVPDYMKRPLQSAWGLPVDQKESLQEYFKHNPLPGANWSGWREDVRLDDIKVKYVDQVGLDPSEFDIWPDDVVRAKQVQAETPNLEVGFENAQSYAQKLKDIFHSHGFYGTQIDIMEADNGGKYDVEVNLEHNRQREVKDLINKETYNVI